MAEETDDSEDLKENWRRQLAIERGYFDHFLPPDAWLEESAIPRWQPEIEGLPLHPGKAKSIAAEQLQAHLRNLDQDEISLISSEARICESENADWYYAIVVQFCWKEIGLFGQPYRGCVLVRMDRVALIVPTIYTTLKPHGLLEPPSE